MSLPVWCHVLSGRGARPARGREFGNGYPISLMNEQTGVKPYFPQLRWRDVTIQDKSFLKEEYKLNTTISRTHCRNIDIAVNGNIYYIYHFSMHS